MQILQQQFESSKKVFTGCSSLGHLASKKKPLVVSLDELKGDKSSKATLEERVKGLITSFYDKAACAEAYPKSLKECFSALQEIVKKKNYTSYTYAYGLAMNQIAEFWKELHDIYGEMVSQINNGTPQAGVDDLVKKVDALLLKVNPSGPDAKFTSSYQFLDTSGGYALLSGARLTRFLTDQSKTGKSYDVQSLLNQRFFRRVWIKFKQQNKALPAPNPADVKADNVLNRRGAGISGAWRVEGGERNDLMPAIASIDNSKNAAGGSMTHRFVNVPGGVADINADDCIITIAAGASVSENAAVQKDLVFGQLLFTLFKGHSAGDFLTLEPSSEGASVVKVTANNNIYMNWVKEANKNNDDEFAQYLGNHLKSNEDELGKLFVIPDTGSLEAKLKSGINEGRPANSGPSHAQANPNSSDANEKAGAVGDGSNSAELFKNILETFSNSQNTTGTAKDLRTKIGTLVSLKTDHFNDSDLTFEQKVCIELAGALINTTLPPLPTPHQGPNQLTNLHI